MIEWKTEVAGETIVLTLSPASVLVDQQAQRDQERIFKEFLKGDN